ncbi:hypothetical protein Dda_5388 [Drechslerella dactyloides]|uniref:Metallo-beta-lactamase domain-containing protein n=1 Tax=Drechslerella dactyloides TaxID=74499 RepID=A0AAD6NK62_DREDA|nr:hypothetical protein Dda_5388 [Drechslerella dactyloides]
MLARPPNSVDPSHFDKLICVRCGIQYEETDRTQRVNCPTCDDPREAVPPTGQAWTTLRDLYDTPSTRDTAEPKYKIDISTDPREPNVTILTTRPRFAIGQSCFVLTTPHGLVIWEIMPFLDQPTVDAINAIGEVKAILISHPHFYNTPFMWSEAFGDVPVYISSVDKHWLMTKDLKGVIRTWEDEIEILPGAKATQLGGHFPGSSVLEFEDKLFVADTIVVTPAALYHFDRQEGYTGFSFQWSVLSKIPLAPPQISKMWDRIRRLNFSTVYGGWELHAGVMQVVRDSEMDERERKEGRTAKFKILDSMRRQVQAMGHEITPDMGLEL